MKVDHKQNDVMDKPDYKVKSEGWEIDETNWNDS